jgi:segregation and condensation protein B
MTDSTGNTETHPLDSMIEALLFVAPGPVTIQQIAAGADLTQEQAEEGLKLLREKYSQGSGLAIQEHRGKFQLTTRPVFGAMIEKFLGLQATSRLSRAAMETLAIVVYKQPVTRPQLDDIRGVNSDGVIKSLLSKGLIEETGRAEGPGRPIIYGTTSDFLQYFGLNSLDELPELDLGEEQAEEIREKVFKD